MLGQLATMAVTVEGKVAVLHGLQFQVAVQRSLAGYLERPIHVDADVQYRDWNTAKSDRQDGNRDLDTSRWRNGE